MNALFAWLPDRRLLERHLCQLCASLQGLGERLRESVAHAVSASVANLVGEVVRALTTDTSTTTFPRTRSTDFWDRDEDAPWLEAERASWRDREERSWDDVDVDRFECAEAVDDSAPSRWARAAAVGCTAAAWWLRRQGGRHPLLTTLGLGAATALVAYVAGPVVAALGSGVLGVAGGLLGLAESLSSGATLAS